MQVQFDDYYRMLDAVMLAGATISRSKGKTGSLMLTVSRSWERRRSLLWLMVVLHRHGIDLRLSSGADSIASKVCYQSCRQPMLRPAFERWYADGRGRARMPSDLVFDLPTLQVWLGEALTATGDGDRRQQVRLGARGMTGSQADRARRGLEALNLTSGVRVIESAANGSASIVMSGHSLALARDRIAPVLPHAMM